MSSTIVGKWNIPVSRQGRTEAFLRQIPKKQSLRQGSGGMCCMEGGLLGEIRK